jgi:hypothetical protein
MTRDEALAQLAKSRAAIVRDVGAVRAEVDVPAKVRASLADRPLLLLGGAVMAGWIAAGPKTRVVVKTKRVRGNAKPTDRESTKETTKRVGIFAFLLSLIRLVLPIVKPALSAYAAKRFSDLAQHVGR